MQFSDIEKGMINVAIVFFSVAVTVAAAELTYRHIELRFRIKGKEVAKGYMSRQDVVA
jgi:peptidoglycan/LPS O-acetylase OafA/YrhL